MVSHFLALSSFVFGGALFGKLTSGLTNPGIQTPDGQTTFPGSPSATAQALAASSAKTSQPGTSTVDGTIGAPTVTSTQPAPPPDGGIGPVQDNVDTVTPGQDNTTVGNSDAPIGAQPRLVPQTWAQANSAKDPSSQMTTKGNVLSLILDAVQGAAAGAAAGVPTNPHISPGIGPSLAAGVDTPFVERRKENLLTQEQLEQQKTAAQTAAIPGHASAELRELNSRSDYYDAAANTKGQRKVGDQIIGPDGKVIYAGLTPDQITANAAAAASGKATGKAAGITNAGGTPEQVLSALGVKPDKQNTTTAQLYLNAADGDPTQAITNMNRDRVANSSAIHGNIAKLKSVDAGDTPAMARTIRGDPQYGGYLKQRDALLSKLATAQSNSFSDPKDIAAMQSQAEWLTQKMVNRRAEITSKPSAPSQQTNAPSQQSFSHVSSDGKWGWNGTQWVAR